MFTIILSEDVHCNIIWGCSLKYYLKDIHYNIISNETEDVNVPKPIDVLH